MIKTIYTVTKHSYWEHFNATPSVSLFDTLEEAKAEANNYERQFFMEEGYYATISSSKKVVITEEEQALHDARQAMKQESPFNYKKEADYFGIITYWDDSKEIFYITHKGPFEKYIHFPRTGECYRMAISSDYFGRVGKGISPIPEGTWSFGPGDKIKVLGGCIHQINKEIGIEDRLDAVVFNVGLKNNKLDFKYSII